MENVNSEKGCLLIAGLALFCFISIGGCIAGCSETKKQNLPKEKKEVIAAEDTSKNLTSKNEQKKPTVVILIDKDGNVHAKEIKEMPKVVMKKENKPLQEALNGQDILQNN